MATERIGIQGVAQESTGTTDQAGPSSKLILIHPELIDEIWPQVEKHLDRIAPHSEGELTTEDFHTALLSKDMQLWVAVDDELQVLASMVSQIISYPRKRVLRILAIGGVDMERWMGHLPAVEDWAMEVGCSSLELWGRKGWQKMLKDWNDSYVVMTKDLKTRMH